jgi:hypothetical protein
MEVLLLVFALIQNAGVEMSTPASVVALIIVLAEVSSA